MCSKWGRCISDFFNACDDVRQGHVLSPKMFSVYVDDLRLCNLNSKVGCHIDDHGIMYVC